ncbi:MAG: PIF1 family DEAD/DEAH box helicase [bacterium]|nr:PIF1 family DEAD/DEAH box helicase [bacterium]
MTQSAALKALKLGYNIFLTGAAGSGKTFVLNKYIQYLKSNKIGVAVTASTGIAATHLNGITIHAWSGFGVKEELREGDFKKIGRNARVRKRLKSAKVLIIDEVSMLHARQLDMVDAICRRFIDKLLPFGGLQVVLSGDLFQLPPVEKDPNKEVEFIFSAWAWSRAGFKICYLNEQHRQKNDELAGVLNSIRGGQVSAREAQILSARIGLALSGQVKPTRLFSHNQEVDQVNNLELAKLRGDIMVYDMRFQGNEKLVSMLKGGCLAPEILRLKKGAQVMFVKNNFDQGYVNGTTGIIEGFDEETKMPIVITHAGKRLTASPEMWSVDIDDIALASIRQVPLRLAWAITIHKSQGMSLDAVEIDLSKSFEFGMGYVALSRVRTLAGMRLLGLNDLALEVNPNILAIDAELQKASAKFFKELEKINLPKPDNRLSASKLNKAYEVKKIRQKYGQAYLPWTEEDDCLLINLFKQGKIKSELAKIFERNKGAISSRLKKLGLLNKPEK